MFQRKTHSDNDVWILGKSTELLWISFSCDVNIAVVQYFLLPAGNVKVLNMKCMRAGIDQSHFGGNEFRFYNQSNSGEEKLYWQSTFQSLHLIGSV